MRKALAVVLSVVASFALVAADAYAQAPTTKVTISGLIDNITTWDRNQSGVDNNFAISGDKEWYSRTRLRPDITAEVGTTKFVLGIEIDYTWGNTGTGVAGNTSGANSGNGAFSGIRGTSGGTGINNDVTSLFELKWGYTEFDVPGTPARLRLGAQPFATTYKPGILATGDFAGANADITIMPNAKLHVTFAQSEESSTGVGDGFLRGEDFAIINSLEITPFKGLDLRPIYAYFRANGATSANSRQGRGGLGNTQGTISGTGTQTALSFPTGAIENRHTIGVDSRWRGGPFSLDPTILYQWGDREFVQTNARGLRSQHRSAWLFDLRGAFEAGPLLLEAGGSYTTGNKAHDDIRVPGTDIHYYESIDQDGGYWGTWCELFCLDVDFNTGLPAPANFFSTMGYDKYGLARLAAKASYNVTPSFTLRANLMNSWTASDVDTSSNKSAATGLISPANKPFGSGADSSYLGTEVDFGFQWRFAPGIALDLMGAHAFMGHGLAVRCSASNAPSTTGATARCSSRVNDVDAIAARVRYTF